MSDVTSEPLSSEPPRGLKKAFLAFALLCLLVLAGVKLYQSTIGERRLVAAAMRADPLSGTAPSFKLADRTGRVVRLSELRGKVVFLNFWATWCGPCREEMPSLVRLAQSMDQRDVVFVAASVDEAWDDVDAFTQRVPLLFTVLLDADKSVSNSYGTTMYPESYVIGKDGELLYKIIGGRDWSNPAASRMLEQAGVRRIGG